MTEYRIENAPRTWKGIAQVAAGGLLEIAQSLNEIAKALNDIGYRMGYPKNVERD